MAEAKKKGKKGIKMLKAHFNTHSYEADEQNPTVKWFLDSKLHALSVAHNELADHVFGQKDLFLCICDAAGNCKQYSKACTYLTEFNPTWVGFYPGQYQVTVPIDEDGNTETHTINDVQQLQNAMSLVKGQSFYFCGVKYAVVLNNNDGNLDNGYELLGESKKHDDANKNDVCIWVRKTKASYFIVNFAKDTRSDRHSFGSATPVMNYLSTYFDKTWLHEDEDLSFFKENDEIPWKS